MKQKMIDLFEDWYDGSGIFSELSSLSPPWGASTTLADDLDIAYFGNFSGEKNISPLIEKMLKKEIFTAEKIAKMLKSLYFEKWGRIWEAYNLDYNVIENYNANETHSISVSETTHVDDDVDHTGTVKNVTGHTGTITDSGSISNTNKKTGTVTTANTGTQSNTKTGTVTTANTGTQKNTKTGQQTVTKTGTVGKVISNETGIYGFNSVLAVGDSNQNGSQTDTNNLTETTNFSTDTAPTTEERTDNLSQLETNNLTEGRTDNLSQLETNNLTETDSGTNGNTRTMGNTDTSTDTFNNSDERDIDTTKSSNTIESLHRSGNIGVTTSTQMLVSEIDFRKMFDYFQLVVFPDIDYLMTRGIY